MYLATAKVLKQVHSLQLLKTNKTSNNNKCCSVHLALMVFGALFREDKIMCVLIP